jgi:hypothetical protein
VDLPAPDVPAAATVCPGSILKRTRHYGTSSPPRVSSVETSSERRGRLCPRTGRPEADVVELDHQAFRDGDGVRLLLDEQFEVQHLEDALEADHRAHIDLHPCTGW